MNPPFVRPSLESSRCEFEVLQMVVAQKTKFLTEIEFEVKGFLQK